MVQGGGGEVPANPLPKTSGPWVVTIPGRPPESITWSRTEARTYYVQIGATYHSMAAARYTSNHRQGSPLCLVCNLYSGRVAEACASLFRALSEAALIRRSIWPLWSGLVTMDGSERPRGLAGGLRLLDSSLYEGTTLYVPALFGVEGTPPPS